jgi:hypothetical protein
MELVGRDLDMDRRTSIPGKLATIGASPLILYASQSKMFYVGHCEENLRHALTTFLLVAARFHCILVPKILACPKKT